MSASAQCRSSRISTTGASASTSATSDSRASTLRGAARVERTRISGKTSASAGKSRTSTVDVPSTSRSASAIAAYGIPDTSSEQRAQPTEMPSQLARHRLEQRRLADAELTLDQHEIAGAVARCLERPAEEAELLAAAEQARWMRATVAP